jgi:hypothetical protein
MREIRKSGLMRAEVTALPGLRYSTDSVVVIFFPIFFQFYSS